MIEAQNQLQYDTQDGMYDLAGLMHYNTGRVYAMTKEELEKLTPKKRLCVLYQRSGTQCAHQSLSALQKPRHGQTLLDTNLHYIKTVSQNFKPEDTRCEKRLSYPYIIQIASFLPLQPQGQLVVLYSS